MKKTLIVALALAASLSATAQSSTNSPYSQYGLGTLAERSGGFNRGMNGVGLGFHDPNQVNTLNPASYSSLDSLTFIFDMGLSGQITNFKEGQTKVNAQNAGFEYVVAGFRLARHLGASFGLLPFTNVGYNYTTSGKIGGTVASTYTNTYFGEGGLHEVYAGLGWEPFRGVAFGANFGYLWGSINRSVTNTYSASTSSINTLARQYAAEVRSYKADFGVQFTSHLGKKDAVTLGLTYSLGHKIGGNPSCLIITNNKLTSVSDTVSLGSNGMKMEIPVMMGAGLMWNHHNKLKLGLDYSLQKWGSTKFPVLTGSDGNTAYSLRDNQFSDRHKLTFGGEYCPAETNNAFFSAIHYRAGISYSTPYLKINGADGPKELGASIGFGLPLSKRHSNRSILNVSAQWVNVKAKDLINENTFRINIGLTFNERWFAKWKVQ